MEIKFTDEELLKITVGAVQTLVQERFQEAVSKRVEELRETLKDFNGPVSDLQQQFAPQPTVKPIQSRGLLVPEGVAFNKKTH